MTATFDQTKKEHSKVLTITKGSQIVFSTPKKQKTKEDWRKQIEKLG